MNNICKAILISTLAGLLPVYASGTFCANVIPEPREMYSKGGTFSIGSAGALDLKFNCRSKQIPALFEQEISKRLVKCGINGRAAQPSVAVDFYIGKADVEKISPVLAREMNDIGSQGYVLETLSAGAGKTIVVAANDMHGLWNAMSTLIQLITPGDKALSFPDVKIVDFPAFDQRALLVDLGGQGYMIGQAAYTFEQWKEYIDWMVDRKYSHIFFEIIGSGKLMGNLDMEKNEWIGYPVDLKSYPQLVCRNRPLRHWDTNKNELVQGSYTAPNVQKEFLRELIDYAKARGLNVQLLIGYDYFTKQLQPVLGIPDRAPDNPQSTAFYDRVLEELITRYSNVDGVALITIETMDPAPGIHQVIIDRIKKAKQIIHKVNPKMEISLLPDYIEFSKTEMDDLRLMNDELKDVRNFYTPHHQPQQRAWNRLRPGGWKYALYTQYAWDYTVYIFPETIRNEMLKVYADGFRSVVSQAWYDDVFRLNFDALAEFTWNPTAGTADEFLDKDIAQRFSEPAREFVKQTLMHTRFDRRMDVLSRQIVQGKIKQTFTYWDMYTYHKYRVNQPFVGELRDDALQSLMAVQAALEAEKDPQARGLLDTVLISAQRRYYFAESVLRLLDALEAVDRRKWSEAEASIQTAESMAGKMMSAARRLGIQYPVALYDDDYAGKVAEYKAMILERKGSLKSAKTKSSADTED